MSNSQTMTVAEAARVLQRTPQCVRDNAYLLGGRKVLGRWVMDAELVQQCAHGVPANDPCPSTSHG
jgi:hypothetical protein